MTTFTPNPKDFLLSSYDYVLPQDSIANQPTSPRESAKLLVYERKTNRIIHSDFYHFCKFIPANTLIVFNDTKVIKARIYARKLNTQTNRLNTKRIEVFYHKPLSRHFPTQFLVQIKGRVKPNDELIIESTSPHSPLAPIQNHLANKTLEIKVRECLPNGLRIVSFYAEQKELVLDEILTILESYGHIPLPPYIKRSDTARDSIDYQSVFASRLGAVAAPTASLHFSQKSLKQICDSFETCFITLHVGGGTFMNVESEDIRAHQIHTESFNIPPSSACKIDQASKLLCIGTTSARSVEHYTRTKLLQGECDIFLYPGKEFKRVDYLLTNFRLPKSTLLMLVSAMIGREKCLELYSLALQHNYKFYSYGDGMLIL